MIIGNYTNIADRGEVGEFTHLPNNGVGVSYYAHGMCHLYNGQLYVVRTNISTTALDIFNYTTKTSIWSDADNDTKYANSAQYGQYLYIGYNTLGSTTLQIKKIDLTDGSESTVWTDGEANNGVGYCGLSWDITEGKIVFYLRASGIDRRVILTLDPTDDSTVELITDEKHVDVHISCDSSYIYYSDTNLIWKRMDWDGANKTTLHTLSSNLAGLTGPNGIHSKAGVVLYDADATNSWSIGNQLKTGYFLNNSMPYYLVGWETTNNSIKVYKLATGDSVTVLETISASHDLNFPMSIYFMPYENFEGIHGISHTMIGQSKSILTIFPDREHN